MSSEENSISKLGSKFEITVFFSGEVKSTLP